MAIHIHALRFRLDNHADDDNGLGLCGIIYICNSSYSSSLSSRNCAIIKSELVYAWRTHPSNPAQSFTCDESSGRQTDETRTYIHIICLVGFWFELNWVEKWQLFWRKLRISKWDEVLWNLIFNKLIINYNFKIQSYEEKGLI